jgi:hypothetical protein
MKTPFIIALIFLFALPACTRSGLDNIAGKGGNATLRIVPKHHNENKNIINAKVYIKYNAQDATTNFDDSADCIMTSGVSTATFRGLKKGNYYLMGIGYDSSIKQSVKGGIPYTINEEISLDIVVPVTETHL